MEKKEIIDGLKDLIKDRESFITEGAPKSWKTDTDRIFEHDKQVLEEAINTIQAQQQEIARIKRQLNCERQTVSMLKSFGLHYGEFPRLKADKLIDKLVADKDEQAKRITQLDEGLQRAKEALKYCAISACMAAQGVAESCINAINALLGGKEDV